MGQTKSFLEHPRIRVIDNMVMNALKLTHDEWEFITKDDDSRTAINDEKCEMVIFSFSAKGLLQASTRNLTKGKKGVCIFKAQACKTEDPAEFARSLNSVDIPKNPFAFIHKAVDSVYGPIAKSETNIKQFSPSVANDILETMSDLTCSFYVLLDKSQGMTVLTLPPHEFLAGELTPTTVHVFEVQIVQWIDSMRELLLVEFPDDQPLTPMDEVHFWKKRRQNLELLSKQLDDPNIKLVVHGISLTFHHLNFISCLLGLNMYTIGLSCGLLAP